MKRIAVIIFSILLVSFSTSFAQDSQLSLKANDRMVEAEGAQMLITDRGMIVTGAGVAYDEDQYTILNASFEMKSEQFLPGLRYGVGFKGLYGRVAEGDEPDDGKFAALGFLIGVEYDLLAGVNPLNLPVDLYSNIVVSPQVLTFADGDRYLEFKAGASFYILENAMVSLEFRRLNIDMDKDEKRDSILLGYTMRFY